MCLFLCIVSCWSPSGDANFEPSRIGSQYPDILYSSISLSLRVLLSHFRKCARHPECWQTAKNTYKGDDSLESVTEVLKTIKIVPEKDGDIGDEEPEFINQISTTNVAVANYGDTLQDNHPEPDPPSYANVACAHNAPISGTNPILDVATSSMDFMGLQDAAPSHTFWKVCQRGRICRWVTPTFHFGGALLVHFWCTFIQKCTKSAPKVPQQYNKSAPSLHQHCTNHV